MKQTEISGAQHVQQMHFCCRLGFFMSFAPIW